MSISEPIPSRRRGKKDQFTSKRAYSGHSCPPSYLSCAIPPSNQRSEIIDLQRPVLLEDISLDRRNQSWLSLRLVSLKRQSQSKAMLIGILH
ncbi:hypothetical protein ACOSQ3_028748 [Xanthoceras sorbifolium]